MSPQNLHLSVHKELNSIISSLIEFSLINDQNFPAIKKLPDNKHEVSFKGADHVSIAMKDIDYGELYKELNSKRSFTARLIDGALIQLSYLFENGVLIKHRLAFYPSPYLQPYQNSDDDYNRDEIYLEIVSRRIIPFPLRFDYDSYAAKDLIHPHCHLTLGDVKDCRIPTSGPITPLWFFDFIIRNFYQTQKINFIDKLPALGKINLKGTITPSEKNVIHINIPTR